MKRRLLSVLIAVGMALTLLPATAQAEELDYVAQIGETGFLSLQEAIDAVDAGQTVKLIKDITLTDTVTIASGNKDFTLDLNNKVVYGGDGIVIRHSGSGTLTITDSGTSGRARIIGGTARLDDGTIYLEGGTVEDTVLKITGGTVIGGYLSSAVYNNGNGGVIVSGTGKVKNTSSGTAIYSAASGKISIGGTALVTSSYRLSTIYMGARKGVDDVALEITGGTVENTGTGYAVYSYNNGKVSIPSGTSVIKGSKAMNIAPDLSRFADVYIMASKSNTDGRDADVIDKGQLKYNAQAESYKYLKFSPAVNVARIGDKKYIDLQEAVYEVKDGETIELLEDITLRREIYTDKSYTIDLNGKALSETVSAERLSHYLGMIVSYEGKLTIVDSHGGGTITGKHTAFYLYGDSSLNIAGGVVKTAEWSEGNTIFHYSSGRVIVSGGSVQNKTERYSAIYVREDGGVEVTDGKVENNGYGPAIYNDSSSQVNVSGGVVSARGGGFNSYAIYNVDDNGRINISGGLVSSGGSYAIFDKSKRGVITLSGGKVESIYSGSGAIKASSEGKIAITGAVVIDGKGAAAMNKAPDLNDNTGYEWRTEQDGSFTPGTTAPYTWNASHTYVEIRTLPEPVSEPVPEPVSEPDDNTTPADTVYNDPGISDAAIWLNGSGLAGDDLLITQALTSGSDYDAMLQLEDENDVFEGTDVFGIYEISLQSGTKSTGSAMCLTFDLSEEYAGQAFTLVHKKEDGTFEYFYATADADGHVTFDTLYELSIFMLVKGTLPDEALDADELNTQAGGVFEMYIWGINVWWFIGIGAALVIGAGITVAVALRKRKKGIDKRAA